MLFPGHHLCMCGIFVKGHDVIYFKALLTAFSTHHIVQQRDVTKGETHSP